MLVQRFRSIARQGREPDRRCVVCRVSCKPAIPWTRTALDHRRSPTQARWSRLSAGDRHVSGLFDAVSRDGIDMENAFRADPGIGWTVRRRGAGGCRDAPLRETALTMAAIGLGLMLLSVLPGSLVARRIAYGVHQLGHAAVGLASGDIVPLAVSRTAR